MTFRPGCLSPHNFFGAVNTQAIKNSFVFLHSALPHPTLSHIIINMKISANFLLLVLSASTVAANSSSSYMRGRSLTTETTTVEVTEETKVQTKNAKEKERKIKDEKVKDKKKKTKDVEEEEVKCPVVWDELGGQCPQLGLSCPFEAILVPSLNDDGTCTGELTCVITGDCECVDDFTGTGDNNWICRIVDLFPVECEGGNPKGAYTSCYHQLN